MKKPKVHQCDCCKDIITDAYRAEMKMFYLSEEYKYLPALFVPRSAKRKVTLCGSCYKKISNASVNEKFG